MSRLLLCGFGSFPEAPQNPSSAVIEALTAQAWAPPSAATAYLTLPVSWTRSAETVLDHAASGAFDGILVVGVAVETDAFRVETVGRNRASLARHDHDGALWLEPLIQADGPAGIAATAPVGAMHQALLSAGLPARLSDDAGDYLCNFTLYRLLAAQAAPAVGFLHVPQARELAEGADFGLDQVDLAVRAAAAAFAEALTRPVA